MYIIARNHGLAIEHFMFANGLPGLSVTEGRKLIVPTRRIPPAASMDTGLLLNLPERGIYLYRNGSVIKFYPVAIGAADKWKTPTGSTTIVNKAVNPTWFPPEWANREEPVLPGPDNPLGDRWMGLGMPGYGIHATNNPSSIGLATSHGCIRMYPEMAHDLFERVHVGMPVKIVYEPVKIGYDPDDRMLYMEVYPDVYGKTPNLMGEANRLLTQLGISGLVDPQALKWVVDRRRGIPEPILSSRVAIRIDGKKQNLRPSPLMIRGKVWVISDVLRDVGANINWDGESKSISINRAGRIVNLQIRENIVNEDEASAYLWQGKSYIPLSYVLRNLGVEFNWCGQETTVHIFSPQPPKQEEMFDKIEFYKEDRDLKVNEEVEHSPLPKSTPAPKRSPGSMEIEL
jgi:L,D-transpeptidase ErfK/SrfK